MDPRPRPAVDIGHIHLKVSDLDRALAFYTGALGLEVSPRADRHAAWLSDGGGRRLLSLRSWNSGEQPPAIHGLYQFGIRYPDRAALGDAVRRARAHGAWAEGASDDGARETVQVRDPDGNTVDLYWERPHSEWSEPRASRPLDLDALIAAAERESDPNSPYAPMTSEARQHLRDLRGRLLHLHKVLLEDTRATYEMDRGRVGSTASLLQLVISDPWFAWLHALSELIVRIDQAVEADSPASEADAASLLEQTEALLTASETGDGFARRYYESLQRQPAVVVAHADVRRLLKAAR